MTEEQKERLEALDEAIRVLGSIAGWIHELAPTKSRTHRRNLCMHAAERLLKVRQRELSTDVRPETGHPWDCICVRCENARGGPKVPPETSSANAEKSRTL